ncbi:hypothetical protein RUL15_004460 [Vibrio parahaemolyticus]|uniref:hypothetical protein n=1 Tax=Vibrio parahaemolyticus TaxID=670 RepID=UPI00112096DA|nr:hypothetical protein [Vibrio parahaemolyticus]ELJ8842021.1 hypothetical protein [Vibrio parahaemolyticus]TOG57574.1 hypothetical protein CGI97_23255 [Vibrio parahaemolyticus]
MTDNYKALCKSQLDAVFLLLIVIISYVLATAWSVLGELSDVGFANYLTFVIVLSILLALYHNQRDFGSQYYERSLKKTHQVTIHYISNESLFKKHTIQLKIAVWATIVLYPLGYYYEGVYKFSTVMLPVIVSIIASRGVDEYRMYKNSVGNNFIISTLGFAVVIFIYTFFHDVSEADRYKLDEYAMMFVFLMFCGFFGAYFIAWFEVLTTKVLDKLKKNT